MGKVIYYDFGKEMRDQERTEIIHRSLERVGKRDYFNEKVREESEADRRRLNELAQEEYYFQELKERGEYVFDRLD